VAAAGRVVAMSLTMFGLSQMFVKCEMSASVRDQGGSCPV
jgi:hypothetical protein